MPTTPAPLRDALLADFPKFEAAFEPWEVETVDALLAGLRARGLTPTQIAVFPTPDGRLVRITYYVDLMDPAWCRQCHLSVTLT
jgi:hypothetical protein